MSTNFFTKAGEMFGGGAVADGLGVIALVVILGVIVIGIAYLILEAKNYSRRSVELYRPTSRGGKFHIDKAKQFTDKNGVTWWKLKTLKKQTTVPPEESTTLLSDGRFYAKGIIDNTGTITWYDAALNWDEIKSKLETKDLYKPISTESKQNYAYQMAYNKQLRSSSWKEQIPLIAGLGSLVIIVAMVMMFMPKAIESASAFQASSLQVAEAQKANIQQMNELLDKTNYLLSQAEATSGQPTPDFSNDGGAPQ